MWRARLCALFIVVAACTAAAAELPAAAAAATLRSTTSAAANATSITVARPASAAAGDVLVAAVSSRLDGWRPISAPAGWTLVRRDSDGGAGATLSQAVYYHVVGGAEASSYTWSFPVARATVAAILDYGGVSNANPVYASSGAYTLSSTNIVAPSVTASAGDVVVAFFSSNGTRGISVPVSLSKRFDALDGSSVELAGADGAVQSTAPTGAETATEPAIDSSNIGQLVALRSASAAPATAPSNTAPPTVSGTAQQGQTLTATAGTWAGTTPMTASYQWRRCDTGGGNCTAIAGATAGTYTLTAADVGTTLRVAVTEANSAGASTASSAQTAVVTSSGGGGLGSALPQLLPQSAGTTYYVDGTAGNDANSGLSTASAFRTIQHALNVAGPGATILVRGGTYVESPVMTGSGTATNPITVENYPGETVDIEPPTCSCDNEGFQFDGASYVRLQGFVIENTKGTSSTNLYVYGGSSHLQIEANELRYSQDQGSFVDDTTSYIAYIANRIHDNGKGHVAGQHQSHGLYIEGSHDFVADNLFYAEPYGFGIQMYPANHDSVVVDNTIVGNGHSGMVVGGSGGVYNITIRNNILANNASYGIEHDSTCPTGTVSVDHNVIYGNPGGAIESGCSTIDSSGGNNLADPLFVNATADDFALQSGSPAIDTADPNWSMPFDLAGVARPQGNGPDIGALERTG